MRVFAFLFLAVALILVEPSPALENAAADQGAQSAIAAADSSRAMVLAADYRDSRFHRDRHFSGADRHHFRHDRFVKRGHRHHHFRGHDRHFLGRDHRFLHRPDRYYGREYPFLYRYDRHRHFRGYGHLGFSVCYRSGSLLFCFGG